MQLSSEMELWSVWLGYDELPSRKKVLCKLSELTADRLKEVYSSELDLYCLRVVR